MIARVFGGFHRSAVMFAAVALAACTPDTNAPTANLGAPAQMTAVPVRAAMSTTLDTAIIGGVLGGNTPISVHVTDAVTGRPLVNQTVTFFSEPGSGNVIRNGGAASSVNTGGTGDVMATWNFGALAGEQRLRVTVKNSTDTVWFVATLPPPDGFSAVSTTQVSATYGGNTIVSVMAVDSAGDPFPAASVRFIAPTGSGKVSYAVVRTGLNGIARTTWTFDSTVAGQQTLFATIEGTTDTLEFDATVPGPPQPDSLIAGGTVSLSGVIGTSVPLTVRVVDSNLRPVPNAQVTFKTLAASGVVNGSGVTKTTTTGLAYATWTFGPAAGTQRLIVTARGLTDTLRYVATIRTPPVATSITATSDTVPTGAAGTTHVVSVVVRDADGAPFAKASVRFRVKTGAGYIPGNLILSDKNGVAQIMWTFGGRPLGAQQLTAELVGASAVPLEFNATVSAGPPAAVQVVTGAMQTSHVHTALTVPVVVKVTDIYGNLIPGLSVTCAITAGGGTIQHATATTDSAGLATCGTWTVGTALGSNTLTVSTASGRSLIVTAMATP